MEKGKKKSTTKKTVKNTKKTSTVSSKKATKTSNEVKKIKTVSRAPKVEIKKSSKKITPKEVEKKEVIKEEIKKDNARNNALICGVILASLAVIALVIYTIMNLNVRTLTCTYENTTDGLKLNEELTMTFKDERIKKIRLIETIKAESKERKADWKSIVETYEKRYKDSNDKAIIVSTSNNSNSYVYKIIVTADAENAKEENLSKYNLGGITETIYPYDRLKSQAETAGFKCK